MDLQASLVFIGVLLVVSIFFAVVVKNMVEGIAVSGKKPYLNGVGWAILIAVAAYFTSLYTADPLELFWFFGGIYLLFGIIHMLFMHHRFFYSNKHNSIRVLIGEIIFGLALIFFSIAVFTALHLIKYKPFYFNPTVFSTLLFFVPVLVFHSFRAGFDIPSASFPTWQYPLDKLIGPPDIGDSGQEIIIGFEVAEKAADNRKRYFRVRAPETCQLSTLFYHFINEYNEPEQKTRIEFIDSGNEPFEWWFYKREKWYRIRKILNPHFSIRESGIRENAVIICERILATKHPSKQIQRIS